MRLVYYGDMLYHHGIKGQRWGKEDFKRILKDLGR